MAKKQEQNQEQKQEQKQSKPLYKIKNWVYTKNKTGIMFRVFAKVADGWNAFNVYVPTEVNVKEENAGVDAFARIKTNEKTGKKYAVVFIPIEYEYKPKFDSEKKAESDDEECPFN